MQLVKHYVFVWDEKGSDQHPTGLWRLHTGCFTRDRADLIAERLRISRDLATRVVSALKKPDLNEEEHEASALAIA